ncbi:hypothetical protein [Streptomyces olivaceus]|uniref:hypothetical protein n=1 Tax=Streptomyces olivaceus TaxID=47716 RepID=UPI0036A93E1A
MAGREILADFLAGNPRGSWPAEEKAAELTASGTPATVVMSLADDAFLVVLEGEPDPEHGRAKEPLPIRPPRPHPQGVTL